MYSHFYVLEIRDRSINEDQPETEDAIHHGKVEHDTSSDGNRVPFQAGPGPPSGDRNEIPVGIPEDLRDLLPAHRPYDRLRPAGFVTRLVPGMEIEIGLPDGETKGLHHGPEVFDMAFIERREGHSDSLIETLPDPVYRNGS